MPPVGGFVALSGVMSGGGGGCRAFSFQSFGAQTETIKGDFFKIEYAPNSDTLKGRLMINFNSSRVRHNGIKVSLEGYLKLALKNSTINTYYRPIDIFELRPIETTLQCKSIEICANDV